MSTELETHAVVRNVLDLMAQDIIWTDALVSFNNGSVVVKPWRSWMLTERDLGDAAGRVSRIEDEFPDGKHRIISGRASGGTRRRPFYDTSEYRVRVLNVALTVEYPKRHIHGGYYGQMAKDGYPEWRCNGCRQKITVTEARRLGLLPALARKASK